MDEYLTTKEISKILKVNIVTIRRWIVGEKLPATYLGKEFRIAKKDFQKFLDDRKLKK